MADPVKDSIKGRKIAILAGEDVNSAHLAAVQAALKEGGAAIHFANEAYSHGRAIAAAGGRRRTSCQSGCIGRASSTA